MFKNNYIYLHECIRLTHLCIHMYRFPNLCLCFFHVGPMIHIFIHRFICEFTHNRRVQCKGGTGSSCATNQACLLRDKSDMSLTCTALQSLLVPKLSANSSRNHAEIVNCAPRKCEVLLCDFLITVIAHYFAHP